MLRRPLYIGCIEWGHIHKTYKSGTRGRTNDRRHDVIVVDALPVRIIPDELWIAVQGRIRAQGSPDKKLQMTCDFPVLLGSSLCRVQQSSTPNRDPIGSKSTHARVVVIVEEPFVFLKYTAKLARLTMLSSLRHVDMSSQNRSSMNE